MLGRGIAAGKNKKLLNIVGKNILIKDRFHMEVRLILTQ